MFSEKERYLLNKIVEKIEHIERVSEHYYSSILMALEDPILGRAALLMQIIRNLRIMMKRVSQ